MRRTPLPVEHVEIEIAEPVPFAGTDPADVIRYAALGAPPAPEDRLEQALVADAALRGLALPGATPLTHEAAGDGRHYAVTTVRDRAGVQIRIARGEPRAVLESVMRVGGGERARAAVAAARLVAEAYRPLAVAVQRDGQPWQLLGYVPVRAWSVPERRRGRPFDYHRVWDLWLRIAHWVWVAAIAVLTVTGYIISDPGWVPTAWVADRDAGYFLGFVRFIHLVAAVVFMLVLIVRAWNLSTSKIPYDRWSALVPFRNRHEVRNMFLTMKHYLFIGEDRAPVYFGHNPLQQLTYTLMYVVFLFQVLTGLALWGLYDSQHWFWGFFHWFNGLFSAQQTRLWHLIVMWVILLFLPVHVYLSIRADSVERSGAISSMVSGGRWIRRGAVFEDWPARARQPENGSAQQAAAQNGSARQQSAQDGSARQQSAQDGSTQQEPARNESAT